MSRDVAVRLDEGQIAEEVNEAVGRGVETAESIAVWLDCNPEEMARLLRDAVVEAVIESTDYRR